MVLFDKKILGICGTKSGRTFDKIKELNLTLEQPDYISVPAIKELPLTLECRVIYKQVQDPRQITEETKTYFIPRMLIAHFTAQTKIFIRRITEKLSVRISSNNIA